MGLDEKLKKERVRTCKENERKKKKKTKRVKRMDRVKEEG